MYWRSLSHLDTGAITLFELPFRKHHVRRCLLCSNGLRKTWFLRQYKEGETPDRKAKFRSDSSRNENETPCVQLLCIANFALRRVLLQVGDFIMSCPVLQPGFVLLMKLRTLAGLYSSAETYADRELKELKPNSYSSAGTKAQ